MDKVVLAFSGGLDTSVCVKLLEEVEKTNQSNFIKGLREQFENRGSLSPRQVECLEKMLKDN